MIHKNFILYFTMLHFIWNISYPKILFFINDYKLFWRLLVYYYKLFSSRLKKASNFAALVCCTAPNEHNLMLKSNGNCSNLAQSEKKFFLTLQKHFLDLPTPLPQPLDPLHPTPPPKKKKKNWNKNIFQSSPLKQKIPVKYVFSIQTISYTYPKSIFMLGEKISYTVPKMFLLLFQKTKYSEQK